MGELSLLAADDKYPVRKTPQTFTQNIRHHRGPPIQDFRSGHGTRSPQGHTLSTRKTVVVLGQHQAELAAQPP